MSRTNPAPSQAQTVPARAEDSFPTTPNRTRRALISPLARAALDNGVSFADVQAYVEGQANDDEHQAAWLGVLGDVL